MTNTFGYVNSYLFVIPYISKRFLIVSAERVYYSNVCIFLVHWYFYFIVLNILFLEYISFVLYIV